MDDLETQRRIAQYMRGACHVHAVAAMRLHGGALAVADLSFLATARHAVRRSTLGDHTEHVAPFPTKQLHQSQQAAFITSLERTPADLLLHQHRLLRVERSGAGYDIASAITTDLGIRLDQFSAMRAFLHAVSKLLSFNGGIV